MTVVPIEAIGALASADIAAQPMASAQAAARVGGFENLLLHGINQVDARVRAADARVVAANLDASIPPHQVMIEMEVAKQSFEFMLQVRSRLVEGYQDIMRMQL